MRFQIAEAGHVWVVDADLKSYFDTIPHDRWLARCEISNVKFEISEAGVLEEAKDGRLTE